MKLLKGLQKDDRFVRYSFDYYQQLRTQEVFSSGQFTIGTILVCASSCWQ
jgi:hypothetical protein